ncbi:M67 family metallopeptidase [SAR202 cluster bacterium AC-647-N09_OGT_505m]|nr:M67 family metallopeptidase [SAR202 cluster bacterium AC-647-N09_OGT_505m]
MLHLDEKYANEMVAHALEDDPNECCGILAGKREEVLKLYRMLNIEASPYRYRMDPKELLNVYREIDDSGWDIVAIYHSHTHSEAYPSATDVRLATWPESRYILVSLLDRENPPIRAFHIENGMVTEEDVRIGNPE